MNTEWKLVPVEPTDDMVGAAFDLFPLRVPGYVNGNAARCAIYAAMLNAAPRAPTSHPIPTGATGNRDWELSCDECNGSGHVFVKHQVAERKTDVQEFKEECEECDGRGFNIAFEDIPGIAEYVKSCRPAATVATEGAVKRLRDAIEGECGGNWMSEKQAAAVLAHLGISAPAAGDALDRDQQRLALWQAIRDITIGNLHDDKLILANLHKAGYVIALAAIAQQSQRKEA